MSHLEILNELAEGDPTTEGDALRYAIDCVERVEFVESGRRIMAARARIAVHNKGVAKQRADRLADELTEATADAERRWDCHPADGITRCGACVTCLTKDLDEANAAIEPLREFVTGYAESECDHPSCGCSETGDPTGCGCPCDVCQARALLKKSNGGPDGE